MRMPEPGCGTSLICEIPSYNKLERYDFGPFNKHRTTLQLVPTLPHFLGHSIYYISSHKMVGNSFSYQNNEILVRYRMVRVNTQ